MPQTLDQIRRAGLDALRQRLGKAGMVRFLQQFDTVVKAIYADWPPRMGRSNDVGRHQEAGNGQTETPAVGADRQSRHVGCTVDGRKTMTHLS